MAQPLATHAPADQPAMGQNLPLDFQMAALICSRLCHDLVGPVGAVNNGVELIADGGDDMLDDAHALIAQSAGQAVRRLRFYRLAFGASKGAVVSHEMAMDVTDPMLADSKLKLDWQDTPLPAGDSSGGLTMKLALNLIMIVAEGMPRGGTVQVRSGPADDGDVIAIDGSGPMATIEPKSLDALERGATAGPEFIDGLDARAIQPYYAARLGASLGLSISVPENGPERVQVIAKRA